jgi:hypothetical protein
MSIVKKREGQMEMSFAMIFSIIIIAVTVAVAFYVISHFLNVSKCTNVGLFYNDLKERTDKAWAEDITQDSYSIKVTSGVKSVCFGNLNQSYDSVDSERYEFLKRYRNFDKNVFLYPSNEACGNELAYYKLGHVKTNKFFCVDVKDGKITVKLTKNIEDSLVELSK